MRVWSILLLAAGYGWAGGHFIPADAPFAAYIFQFCMLGILFLLATNFLKELAGRRATSSRAKRTVTGLTIYAVLTLIINVANIIHGSIQNNAYGFHKTFADIAPVALIVTGDILWLLTIRRLPARVPGPDRP